MKSLLPEKCRRSVVTSQSVITGSFTVILDRNGDCKLIVGNKEIDNYVTPELVSVNCYSKRFAKETRGN